MFSEVVTVVGNFLTMVWYVLTGTSFVLFKPATIKDAWTHRRLEKLSYYLPKGVGGGSISAMLTNTGVVQRCFNGATFAELPWKGVDTVYWANELAIDDSVFRMFMVKVVSLCSLCFTKRQRATGIQANNVSHFYGFDDEASGMIAMSIDSNGKYVLSSHVEWVLFHHLTDKSSLFALLKAA